ncbi:MAG: type II secretion system protein GspC [Polyangiaceae bacterium]
MVFERILRRNFGSAAVLFGTAFAAFLGAQGVIRIAEAAIIPDAKLLAAAPPLDDVDPVLDARANKSAAAILTRNPFDSETGSLLGADSNAERVLRDPASAPACDDVRILGIAESADADWSFAALSTFAPDAKSQLRRRGSNFGDKRVEYVGWDRVWLSSQGVLCQANLSSGIADGATTVKKPAPKTIVDPAIAKGIHRTSATQFEIQRSTLNKVLGNQSELTKIRVVPETEGVRLFGIKSGSVLDLIGLQNGDRVDNINGFEISTPQKAMAAYAQLASADHLQVHVNRKGSGMQINYDIR